MLTVASVVASGVSVPGSSVSEGPVVPPELPLRILYVVNVCFPRTTGGIYHREPVSCQSERLD